MLRPMFGHRPKPKRFDLPLRYYDPEKEARESDREKRRIKFQTHNRVRPKQSITIVFFALLLAFIVYLISL